MFGVRDAGRSQILNDDKGMPEVEMIEYSVAVRLVVVCRLVGNILSKEKQLIKTKTNSATEVEGQGETTCDSRQKVKNTIVTRRLSVMNNNCWIFVGVRFSGQ